MCCNGLISSFDQIDRKRFSQRNEKMVASHEDAALILQIVRWGTEIGIEKATRELFADSFDAASVSVDHPSVRTILVFGETIATLVKHGVLDKELVTDLWWVDGVWARVGPAARRERERLGESRFYANFEALATAR